MNGRLNQAYMAKLTSGILDTIITASMVEHDGQRTAMVMNAEVIEVLTTAIAGLVAGSACVTAPSQRRRWCDDLARHLHRKITGFQDHTAAHCAPFSTITIDPS